MGKMIDRDEVVDLVLARLKAAAVEYGDVRLLESRSQVISGEDRRIARIQDNEDSGFGVRALYRGAWGFASSSVLTAGEVRRVTDLAIEIAKGSARLANEPVALCPEPVHVDSVTTASRIDPFSVPLQEKTRLLLETMETLHKQTGIARSSASLWARRDKKVFASTEGSRLQFDLLAVAGDFEATAVHAGRFASRGFNTPHLRTGFELITDAQFLREAPRVAAQAVEKVRAPEVEAGDYDLLLDP